MTLPLRALLVAVLGLAAALLVWWAVADRSYDVRGRVAGFGGDGRTVFVEHEEVPGYMPAMTMPFEARDALPPLDVGDAVAFRLVVGAERSWIEGVERLPDDAVPVHPAGEGTPTPSGGEGGPLLAPGDPVPDVDLVDQAGDPVRLSDYRGQALVLTFVYTRCPVPDYCPLMSRNFQRLQPELQRAFGGRAELLSVSFDPEHDTPEVLADYAARYTDDLSTWTFAAPDAEGLARLTAPFGVFAEAEGGQITHNLVTAVVGPDGRLVRLWRGNDWTPAEVRAAVAVALDGAHVRPTSLGAQPPVRPGALARPTAGGPVSSPFGWRKHPVSGRLRHHDGVDLAVPLGTPVRAVADGRVRSVGRRRGYGLVVEVDHPGGGPARSLYAHLSAADAALRPGDRVARGQVVGESGGLSGRDGVSTGPHLHVELRDPSGRPLDPARLLPGLGGHAAPRTAAPPAALPAGFRYRTAADERVLAPDVRTEYARRDTVDIWPSAGPPPRGTERLPDVALPDYPDSVRPAATAGAPAPPASPS